MGSTHLKKCQWSWILSPIFGVHIKNLRNRHLVNQFPQKSHSELLFSCKCSHPAGGSSNSPVPAMRSKPTKPWRNHHRSWQVPYYENGKCFIAIVRLLYLWNHHPPGDSIRGRLLSPILEVTNNPFLKVAFSPSQTGLGLNHPITEGPKASDTLPWPGVTCCNVLPRPCNAAGKRIYDLYITDHHGDMASTVQWWSYEYYMMDVDGFQMGWTHQLIKFFWVCFWRMLLLMLLMVRKSGGKTTWDVQNLVNIGKNYQPQLVKAFFHRTVLWHSHEVLPILWHRCTINSCCLCFKHLRMIHSQTGTIFGSRPVPHIFCQRYLLTFDAK